MTSKLKYNGDNFDEWWNSLNREEKDHIKKVVIARLECIPNDWRLSIG